MTDPVVYISVVFTDEQEAQVRAAMAQYDVTWSDLERIDNPDYHHWAYQIRLVFGRRKIHGDDDYADWQAGDTFIDADDPHGTPFVAVSVDHDYQFVHYHDQEQGRVIVRFTSIRRVTKGRR